MLAHWPAHARRVTIYPHDIFPQLRRALRTEAAPYMRGAHDWLPVLTSFNCIKLHFKLHCFCLTWKASVACRGFCTIVLHWLDKMLTTLYCTAHPGRFSGSGGEESGSRFIVVISYTQECLWTPQCMVYGSTSQLYYGFLMCMGCIYNWILWASLSEFLLFHTLRV